MSSKSDGFTKILGYKYQEMVALKECFEAKDGTKIYLECFGDVSDGKTSTEVKQSLKKGTWKVEKIKLLNIVQDQTKVTLLNL